MPAPPAWRRFSRSRRALPEGPACRLLEHALATQPRRLASHHRRVGTMSYLLARHAGLDADAARAVGAAGSLHDIGMTFIPGNLLEREGRLSAREKSIVHEHSAWGAELLALTGEPELALAAQVAREHHERYDGSGYPDRLVGDEISLAARIVAVCAVYDALRRPRRGKPALDHEAAVGVLRHGDDQSGPGAFDPALCALFAEHGVEFRRIVDDRCG